MIERISDRNLEPVVTISRGAFTPDPDRWAVIVDENGRPTSAIPPGATSVPDLILVLDATTPVALALTSDVVNRLDDGIPVIVTGEATVLGLWTAADRAMAVAHGAIRGDALPGDLQLPGPIKKKDITRRCRYAEGGLTCDTEIAVPEKPEVMPACTPRAGLTTHTFRW
jgi:hypothetical protein